MKKMKRKKQIYETLLEHTKRTEKYFDKFWQLKKCDDILDRFCSVYGKTK
mgnify:CR=1 FL=1